MLRQERIRQRLRVVIVKLSGWLLQIIATVRWLLRIIAA